MQWRIEDFPDRGHLLFGRIFAENCMKMQEIGLRERGHASLAPPPRPLDPRMTCNTIY